jgi:hypothetical protein
MPLQHFWTKKHQRQYLYDTTVSFPAKIFYIYLAIHNTINLYPQYKDNIFLKPFKLQYNKQ